MRMLVSGASGFIGSALVPALRAAGHHVIRLARPSSQLSEPVIRWDPAAGVLDATPVEGLEAVIHLAGESIIGRWTPTKKAAIRDSRMHGTRLLCETLAKMTNPPRVMVCASAIGYYGNRGEELLTEQSAPGQGFLADVGQAWEAATDPARHAGIRVVNLRIGLVLSPVGGALRQMLPPFRFGMGGPLGSGRQHMSWIAMDDLLGAVGHALTTEALQGPVNAVAPHPVTNREFTRTLGRVLSRPTVMTVPTIAVRWLFGEMGEELLLASTRAEPARLLATGYHFRYPNLEDALRHLLRPTAR